MYSFISITPDYYCRTEIQTYEGKRRAAYPMSLQRGRRATKTPAATRGATLRFEEVLEDNFCIRFFSAHCSQLQKFGEF